MNKIFPIIFITLSLTACQASKNAHPEYVAPATTPAPPPITIKEKQTLTSADIQNCHSKINEIKRFDRKQYNALHSSLTKVERNQSSLNASQEYASPQTMDYIRYQQNKSVETICSEASQKLDKLMVRKALASSY